MPIRRLAVLLIFASACRKSVERAAPLAEITSFDCASSLPEKSGELVRAKQLGGPGGAAWNWDGGELVCAVRLSLHCLAQPIVTISAGDHTQTAQVSRPSTETALARATFPPALWHSSLASTPQAIATLRMRARVEARCEGTDHTFTATDDFNAAFASGE